MSRLLDWLALAMLGAMLGAGNFTLATIAAAYLGYPIPARNFAEWLASIPGVVGP